ncbi:peptidase S15 [Candidatus Magnetomorum sp. HK-1]|nr:peptidase S15 [Candidatus Magnetomorum sp. HK-1]
MKKYVFIFFLISMSACTSVDTKQFYKNINLKSKLEKTYYHVTIQSFDGVKIRATVFQPDLSPNETAPLIIQTHGFGGFRTSSPISFYAKWMIPGQIAIHAWKQGYWVISYDQRGFGGSGGNINIMDPDIEVRDATIVLDWAIENLPRIRMDKTNDPKVGMVGESYGGGVQLLASVMDSRIDAIIPIATWYDLSSALGSNGYVKTGWGAILVPVGIFGSVFDFNILFTKRYLKMFTGYMNEDATREMYDHSLASFCEQNRFPQADAFLINGFRDIMFPFNQALANKNCFEEAGRDVRLIEVQGGHLFLTQRLTGMPLFNMEHEIHCDTNTFNLLDLAVDWWNEKLKDIPNAAQHIPKMCLTLDYQSGVTKLPDIYGQEIVKIPKTRVISLTSGLFEWFMGPIDRLTALPFKDKPATSMDQTRKHGGWFRPAFIPLHVVTDEKYIVGIPNGNFNLTSKNICVTPVLFAGFGIKRLKSRYVDVISEQVVPIPAGKHDISFPGIASPLKKGDIIGMVIHGSHSQYFWNGNWIPARAWIEGNVMLPGMGKKSSNSTICRSKK